MTTRRQFLQAAALGAAACALPSLAREAKPASPRVFAVFTKHLLGLAYEPLADALAGIGVTAIEAPIRPQGHVEPERVEEDLPKLVAALQKRGIAIAVLASGINAVNAKQRAEKVLRTAKALGIARYRMEWYRYDLRRPLWPQLDELKPRLKDLVALSREIGILPCYQNHSGRDYIGGPVWDMALLMRDFPATELAWCFDIMHATVEGGSSWPIQVQLVKERIGAAYFKDFAWVGKGRQSVPLGEGVVSRDYVAQLKQAGYAGPVSLHLEYLTGDIKDAGYLPAALAATRRDLATLKSWWE
jgi:sugar phosphate isomerase/epimerase